MPLYTCGVESQTGPWRLKENTKKGIWCFFMKKKEEKSQVRKVNGWHSVQEILESSRLQKLVDLPQASPDSWVRFRSRNDQGGS